MTRTEVRDGKVYRVVTLPEVKPRKRKKPMMTKREARAIAVTGKKKGRGLPSQVGTCSGCGRVRKIKRRPKAANGHKLAYCAECVRERRKKAVPR